MCEDFLGFSFTAQDVYLSYVPLTHVYEQIMHIDAVMFGFCIGYSSGDVMNLMISNSSNQQFSGPFLCFLTRYIRKSMKILKKNPSFYKVCFIVRLNQNFGIIKSMEFLNITFTILYFSA